MSEFTAVVALTRSAGQNHGMTASPTLREQVAEEVRALLARRRMSASGLARELKVSQTYVWRRLTGETAFDLDDIERIARVLNVEPSDLMSTTGSLPVTSPRTSPERVSAIRKAYPHAPVRPRDGRPNGRPRTSVTPQQRRPVRIA